METSYKKAMLFESFLNKTLGVSDKNHLAPMKNLIDTENDGKPMLPSLGSFDSQLAKVKLTLDKAFSVIIKKAKLKEEKDYLKKLQTEVSNGQNTASILKTISLSLEFLSANEL